MIEIEMTAEALLYKLVELVGQDKLDSKKPVWAKVLDDDRRVARLISISVDPTDNGLILNIDDPEFEYYNT